MQKEKKQGGRGQKIRCCWVTSVSFVRNRIKPFTSHLCYHLTLAGGVLPNYHRVFVIKCAFEVLRSLSWGRHRNFVFLLTHLSRSFHYFYVFINNVAMICFIIMTNCSGYLRWQLKRNSVNLFIATTLCLPLSALLCWGEGFLTKDWHLRSGLWMMLFQTTTVFSVDVRAAGTALGEL